MTDNIHPHWTSTDNDSADGEQVTNAEKRQEPPSVRRGVHGAIPKKVKINKKGAYGAFLAGSAGIAVVVLIFVQGVSFITANLSHKDSQGNVKSSTGALIERIERKTKKASDGSGDAIDDLPPIPSLSDMPIENGGSSAVPTQTTAPTAPTAPTATPVAPATMPVHAVPSPQVPPDNTVPPVIDIGDNLNSNKAPSWPSMLRVNRFRLGSGLVPKFAPTEQLPIHVVRRTTEQMHEAASDRPAGVSPLVSRQPATGPAIWVTGFLSLLVFPLFRMWRKGEA